MKKRSAMLVAASLVAALLAGGTALSFSLAGGTAAAQDSRVEPIVKTRHRTITVHKRAKAEPARVVTIASQPSTSSSTSADPASTTWDDDADEQEPEAEDQEDQNEVQHEDDAFEDQSGHVRSEDSGGDD